MRVLGVDACRIGWVGVRLDSTRPDSTRLDSTRLDSTRLDSTGPGRVWFAGARLAAALVDLIDGEPDGELDVVGVDIPLGFPDAGWRAADALAAAALGRLRSSVFPVPPRAVWQEPDYARANRRCRELTGGGLSVQTFGLRAKVLEANALRDTGRPLVEIHPELSFATLRGEPLRHGKKSWTGQAVRRELLARAGITLPDDPGPAGAVAPDDLLDAAAVAWSALRLARGEATCRPDPPPTDAAGRPLAIWA